MCHYGITRLKEETSADDLQRFLNSKEVIHRNQDDALALYRKVNPELNLFHSYGGFA